MYVLLFIVLFSSSGRFFVRPHIFSFLFLSLFWLFLIKFEKSGNFKYLILICAVFPLWVNLHGSFVVGIILISLFLMEELLLNLNVQVADLIKNRNLNYLFFCLIAVSVLSLLNPYGLKLIKFVLFTHKREESLRYINEWRSFDVISFVLFFFTKNLFYKLLFWISFALVIFNSVICIKNKRLNFIPWIIWFFALAYLSVKHARFIALFSFGVAPMVAMLLEENRTHLERFSKKCSLFLLILIFAFLFKNFTSPLAFYNFGFGVNNRIYPVDNANFIKSNSLPSNLYNIYGWGGYLIWKLYPEYKVFIDGRTPSLYNDNFYWIYRMADSASEPVWEKLLAKYNIHTVIIKSRKLAEFLIKKYHFNLLNIDDISYVLSRESKIKPLKFWKPLLEGDIVDYAKNNKNKMEEIIKELYGIRANSPHSVKVLVMLGRIYLDAKSQPKEALKLFKEALNLDPYSPDIYFNIGLCYQKLGKSQEAINYYLKSLKYNPRHRKALLALIYKYFDLGDYKRTVKYFKKLTKFYGDLRKADVYYKAGVSYLRLYDYKRSCDYLSRAWWLKYNSPSLYVYLGDCNYALGNYKKAKHFYEKAYKLNPANKFILQRIEKIKKLIGEK